MAGGRKGHELFSARHPTISINTRLGLSVHSSEEAKATAQGCAVERRRNAWGQGQERKEEKRQSRNSSTWEVTRGEKKEEER